MRRGGALRRLPAPDGWSSTAIALTLIGVGSIDLR
ncbi:Uncharacterised protein [Nocardia africana]|uniref:Uncharacterized protein n=1 Tax=Nocardia africana TaxID=134964 RepID=A0A378WPY0_9NOCA|nr:Uncharacterised protein [Nocardia africana]